MGTTTETKRLPVSGASLHYEVRGTGPVLLLICGGVYDAAAFGPLAARLADRYTVVTYDRRGNSRSPLDGPPGPQSIAQHADDAYRVLAAVGVTEAAPAYVFGNSSGAMIGLDLAARHPALVRVLVAHEPPLFELLPERDHWRGVMREVEAAFREGGSAAAGQVLGAALAMSGSPTDEATPGGADPGDAGPGGAGRGGAALGEAGRGGAALGEAGPGGAALGEAGPGDVRRGDAGPGGARRDEARTGDARRDEVRSGGEGPGDDGQGGASAGDSRDGSDGSDESGRRIPGGSEAPAAVDAETAAMLARFAVNNEFFLEFEVPPFARYVPDAAALTGTTTRVVPAAGAASHGEPPARAAYAVGELLGVRTMTFPGDHGGFGLEVDAFARRLTEVIEAVH